ncbi:MAG: hypothetical protein ACI8Y3_000039 [Paraglaciecola sp.]|jgi:hypothetical protein
MSKQPKTLSRQSGRRAADAFDLSRLKARQLSGEFSRAFNMDVK